MKRERAEFGAAGYEIDRLDFSLGTPLHALLLASAQGFSDRARAKQYDSLTLISNGTDEWYTQSGAKCGVSVS